MGKAGKWILNFLVGKKDEKHSKKKKLGSSFSAGNLTASRTQSDSHNLKLKWSFRKTTGNLIAHKLSKSVDSIDTEQVPKQEAMANSKAERKKQLSAVQTAATTRIQSVYRSHSKVLNQALADGNAEQNKQFSAVRTAAATRIQSVYRSHLARKALLALRGLVKLQALVRGHLVRKQTAATLKSMQALIAIQVRARVHRIQIVEKENEVLTRRRSVNNRRGLKRLVTDSNEFRRPIESRSGYVSRPIIGRIENELSPSFGRDRAISKRHSDCVPHDHPFYPNFMAKTESSRAKVRSQSEPKQRPGSSLRPKSKQSLSLDDQVQNSLENQKHNGYEDHDRWFMKLHRLRKTSKNLADDQMYDVRYEPYLALY